MKVEVYRDKAGAWRWRLKARNGRIVADGAEGYVRQGNAVRACAAMCKLCGPGTLQRAFAAPTIVE